MKPVEFKQQNCIIAKNQKQYLQLPSFQDGVHGGRTISCWKLSFSERIKILFYGKIWDYRLNFDKPLQPIKILVDNPFNMKMEKIDNV